MKQLIVSLIFSSSFVGAFTQQETEKDKQSSPAEIIRRVNGKIICGDFIPIFKQEKLTDKNEHQTTDTSIEDIYWVLGNLFYYKTQPEVAKQKRTKRNNF
ncbi:MAG: hypothetical protein ACLGGV_04160 [Bacteroidia bacterium]